LVDELEATQGRLRAERKRRGVAEPYRVAEPIPIATTTPPYRASIIAVDEYEIPSRPCGARDHVWLAWHDEGLKPAMIRDRHNEENPDDVVTIGVVKKGLQNAERERAAAKRGGSPA